MAIIKLHCLKTTDENGKNIFELCKNDESILRITFNPKKQTAKINCFDTRRKFKIDKEGFLNNKTILKNEYGVKIGQLKYENWNKIEGSIELNGERYYYSNKIQTELIFRKNKSKEPVLICELKPNHINKFEHYSNLNEATDYTYLLMALGWFLLVPAAKEKILATH